MFRYSPIGSRVALAAVVASLISAPASAWFQPMTPPTYGDADTRGDGNSGVGERAILGSDAAPTPTAPPMVTEIAARFGGAGGRFGFARMGAFGAGRIGAPVYGTGLSELNSPSKGIGGSDTGRTGAPVKGTGVSELNPPSKGIGGSDLGRTGAPVYGTGVSELNPPRTGGTEPVAHGPSFGTGGFGIPPIGMDPPVGTDAGSGAESGDPLAAASRQAQAAIAACRVDVYLAPCVSDALDKYAKALDEIAPDLPPQLHVLPSIVRQAAHRVRAARTNAEVTKVVAQAVSEVNKTIALLRATDPNAAPVGNQVGRDIDRTLAVAEVKLLRVSSL